jgi:hypothetical protein
MMNLFNLKNLSLIILATVSFLLTEQIALAETNTKQTSYKNSQDLDINPQNFQQLTSASNLNKSLSQTNNSLRSTKTNRIAQTEIEVDPGRATRSGSSYIGIGGNIGLGGDTTVGRTAFSVISKIGLTDYLSFRPTALIDEDLTFLVPITVDFFGDNVPETGLYAAPYLGGGLAITTGEDDNLGALVTAGLDVPISSRLTANTAVNLKFIDNTDVGILLGVGYNF